MRFTLPLLALTAVIPATGALAHHSFSAMYDADKPVRLVGKLTRIDWTNPHSYFYLDVAGRNGRVVNWSCEGAGPGALSRRGFKRGAIKVGDTLVVDGFLAKSGARIVDARRVTLPDGTIINGGTPGDGGPETGGATRPGA